MELIAYRRVSTKGQIDAYGLDSQETDINAFAETNGHTIVDRYVDGALTGTLPIDQRPGLTAAVDAVRLGIAGGIVCGKIDRFARELLVQEAVFTSVWKTDGHVYTADYGEWLRDDPSDPMRTLIRHVVGAVAQFERAMITNRLRGGIEAKRAAGKHATGQYRYGTHGVGRGRERDAGVNPDEQGAVEIVKSMKAAGHTYRAIATALNESGINPRRAAAWSPAVVWNIANR